MDARGLTYALANFVEETRYEDLPSSVIEAMKKYVLDVIGCGFVGYDLPWTMIVADVIAEEGGNAECSVFGRSAKVSMLQAAMLNGVMIGGFESENVGHFAHPGGTVPPATFAFAERAHTSGRDLLLALALGYEVVCRIGEGQTGRVETERGFHNPTANGPFSAAVSVGKLSGFDATTIANALGIAGSYCGGLTEYCWNGDMIRRIHLGLASRNGLEAALLAAKGFTGPVTVLEGTFGYYNAFSPSPKLEAVLPHLGEEWLLESLKVKAYPLHGTCQDQVAAVVELKRDHAIDPASVTRVHLRSHHELEERHLERTPGSEMAAQYSLPFNIAVAICRDLSDPRQYDTTTLTDPLILEVAQRITWEVVEHDTSGAPDEIAITAGTETYVGHAVPPYRGSIGNLADFDDVEDKFRRYSKHLLDDARQSAIVEMVRSLDDLEDFSELARHFRVE